jgi:hypothetical protein
MLESLSIASFLILLNVGMASSTLNAGTMEEQFSFHAKEMWPSTLTSRDCNSFLLLFFFNMTSANQIGKATQDSHNLGT